jgi:hypothetical protein
MAASDFENESARQAAGFFRPERKYTKAEVDAGFEEMAKRSEARAESLKADPAEWVSTSRCEAEDMPTEEFNALRDPRVSAVQIGDDLRIEFHKAEADADRVAGRAPWANGGGITYSPNIPKTNAEMFSVEPIPPPDGKVEGIAARIRSERIKRLEELQRERMELTMHYADNTGDRETVDKINNLDERIRALGAIPAGPDIDPDPLDDPEVYCFDPERFPELHASSFCAIGRAGR